jgi:hypothetical protein
MICQLFNWLSGGYSGLSTLQLALVGIGCLLTYDLLSRRRKNSASSASASSASANNVSPEPQARPEHRRAA